MMAEEWWPGGEVNVTWRTSSFSSGGAGNCVEIANGAGRVLVRDSKDRHGSVLVFGRAAWAVFVGALR